MYRFVAALAIRSCVALFAIAVVPAAQAEKSGRGLASGFEVEYLKTIATITCRPCA